jgi:hypothetical protein
MVPAVRPLGSPSMAQGCARIDSRPDQAKMGSDGCVEVHHARLLVIIGVRKRFHTTWTHNGLWSPAEKLRGQIALTSSTERN